MHRDMAGEMLSKGVAHGDLDPVRRRPLEHEDRDGGARRPGDGTRTFSRRFVGEHDGRTGRGLGLDRDGAEANDTCMARGRGGNTGPQRERSHGRRGPEIGSGQSQVAVVDHPVAIDIGPCGLPPRQGRGGADAGADPVQVGGRDLVRVIDIAGEPEVDGVGGAETRRAEPPRHRVGSRAQPDQQATARRLGLCLAGHGRHPDVAQRSIGRADAAVDAEEDVIVVGGVERGRIEHEFDRDTRRKPGTRARERRERPETVGGHEHPRFQPLAVEATAGTASRAC